MNGRGQKWRRVVASTIREDGRPGFETLSCGHLGRRLTGSPPATKRQCETCEAGSGHVAFWLQLGDVPIVGASDSARHTDRPSTSPADAEDATLGT